MKDISCLTGKETHIVLMWPDAQWQNFKMKILFVKHLMILHCRLYNFDHNGPSINDRFIFCAIIKVPVIKMSSQGCALATPVAPYD